MKFLFVWITVGVLLIFSLIFAFSASARSWILATDSRRNFLATIVATFLGALLGILAALDVDHIVTERQRIRQEKQQKDLAVKSERDLLVAIDRALQQNDELLERLTRDLRVDRVVNYNVDPLFLEATAEKRYRILNGISLNQDIEEIRSELAILYRMLQTQFDTAYGIESRTTDFAQQRAQLIDSTRKRISKTKNKIDATRNTLRKRIGTLPNG